MKTLVELNGHEFFIKVLEPNIEDSPSSRYQASCGLVYSEIYTSSSAAITSLYQQLFVVFGIGISKNQDWNYAGTSYQSSFVNNIGKRRLLYVQSFIASKCNITIYEENKFKTIINGTTPTDSWLKID
ncbi:9856_t:CDS:2, partial [Gigaspora rosea]